MTQETRKTIVFIAALWTAAMVIFLRALPLNPGVEWFDVAVFVGLAAVSERWYVGTSQESGMSLSFTVHFAAAILLGPAAAMVIAIGGLVITDGLIRRNPLLRTAFNIGQMAVAVGLCGLAYQALDVAGPVDLVADAPALALAALVYLVVNDSLVAGVLSIHGRSFFQEWRLSFKDILLPYASMAPLGALAAYAYQSAPLALLYFVPLVLVVYDGFKLFVSLQRETDHALVALADSIDRRDQYTYQHSVHVAHHVEAIAHQMGLSPRETDLMVAAARVHDLGKIATDNRLLLKPTALTPDERRLIEGHVTEGEEIAGKFSMFHRGRLFIRHHHERWDGTGYPDGLSTTQIPLGARLISVADAYDAMTSDRPYRTALSREKAVLELLHCSGTQFDPAVVRSFIDALDAQEALEPTPALKKTAQQPQPWSPTDITEALSARRDPAQLWASACFTLSRLLDVPHCVIHRMDEQGGLVCVASVVDGEWYPDSLGEQVDLAAWTTGRLALSSREAVLITSLDDPRLSEAERAEMLSWRETAVLLAPLVVKDEVIGMAEIGEIRADRTITSDQTAAAEPLCRLIAEAIHDVGVIDDQRLHARRLSSLLESSRAVAGARSAEEALEIVTRRAGDLFDLSSCVAYEYDQEQDAVVARAAWERTPSGWDRLGEPLTLADHPVERELLASGNARVECVSDLDLDPASKATMERWSEKSCLTVPMRSVDGPMGLLTLWDSARERRYTDDELALATSLAELAGEAVRGAKLLRRLRGLSETDALTGLANRRKIYDFLGPVQARAARNGGQYSMIMLDIDAFKSLNDAHGHQAGDAVLKQVAGALRQHTRASDIVGRYGGDEFLLILPDASAHEASALAEKLREALASQACLTPEGEPFPLRASFGIAAYPRDGRDAHDLVGAADANLYASKRRGGDAVTGGDSDVRPALIAAG